MKRGLTISLAGLVCAAVVCWLPLDVAASPESDAACNDLVVVGRVSRATEGRLVESGPLGGWNSSWALEIRVKRVLRGTEHRRVLTVSAAAHAQIRQDKDFVFHLIPGRDGAYGVRSADLDFKRAMAELALCN